MALQEHGRRFGDLRLDTGSDDSLKDIGCGGQNHDEENLHTIMLGRRSQTTEQASRATPPMRIPTGNEHAVSDQVDQDGSGEHSSLELYLSTRKTSISFSNEIKLDSGRSQNISQPLEKPVKIRTRGRSILQAMSDEKAKAARAHSESHRTHYDTRTGRHLPKYSTTPPEDLARIGEQRFPLLQSTVDELARELRSEDANAMSMTSQSTMSPISEQLQTPRDEPPDFLLSPSPFQHAHASSFEELPPIRRTASQRWRDGESAADFFTRASMRKASENNRKLTRRRTSGPLKSPSSAASSFLGAFSVGSSGDVGDSQTQCDADGQTIGDNYVLGKQIGFGGFSVIKEVTQMQASGTQRKLAVKIVRRNIEGKSEAENEQAQAEFEHEVELWRFLNHPRILPLEAVYKTDEATFCFIPLNNGGTLFDLIRKNRQGLPLEQARRFTYQLASALRYLHRDARVVHRDVKLENILLSHAVSSPPINNAVGVGGVGGDIRLCDFGMSEWISSDNGSGPPSPRINSADRPPQKTIGPAETSTSAFAGGSLEYAAPEILRVANSSSSSHSHSHSHSPSSDRAIVSPAVDIWAMGVCIYSMVVGSRPFSDSFQPRVVMAILAGDWDRARLRDKAGGDSSQDAQDLLDLVEGCLEMDPAQRWEVGDVLECAWLANVAAEDDDDDGERRSGQGRSGWRL